jgi:hypothetical protein
VIAFQITVHARPTEVSHGPTIEIEGRNVQTLAIVPEMLGTQFTISFEEASARLERLDRMFFEPDGSFVWTSSQLELPWQVDGNLFDRSGRLLFVDLKGSCPQQEFEQLLSIFGWPETPVMIQLTREAVFLDVVEFRNFATTESH